MNFTQLRYFTIVARSGGIRAASELLRVAASAVSRQIQQLEHQVGRPLFERHTRGMRLTEAGEIYAQHANGCRANPLRAWLFPADAPDLACAILRGNSLAQVVRQLPLLNLPRWGAAGHGMTY